MKAQDVMSRDIVTVPPDASVLQAARLMLQRKFSGLPVVSAAGELVGIVTEGDFLRRVETGTIVRRPRWVEFLIGPGKLAAEYTHAAGRVVSEVMTTEVHTVTEDTSLDQVVELMQRKHIKRLPVMRGDKLVGIITRLDLVHAFVTAAPKDASAESDDGTIRHRVLDTVKTLSWAPLAVDVVVTDGKVRLIGTILDERQRDALKVAVENTPGVKGVQDELVWIEPMSGIVIEPRAA